MAEKEISDLQTENTRLKKLLVDSIAGSPLGTASNPNSHRHTTNAHGVTESFDNLNDELEVWRSKFLSSCVLVEQLQTHNHDLYETISEASEIIKTLKSKASLTQQQYEGINEWLRKTKGYPSKAHPDNSYNDETEPL